MYDLVMEYGNTSGNKSCIQANTTAHIERRTHRIYNIGICGAWWDAVTIGVNTQINGADSGNPFSVTGCRGGMYCIDGGVFSGAYSINGITTVGGNSGFGSWLRNMGQLNSGSNQCFMVNNYYSTYQQGLCYASMGGTGVNSGNSLSNGSIYGY
jgi:hypothetical protein